MTKKCEITGSAVYGFTVHCYVSNGNEWKMVSERIYSTLLAAFMAIKEHMKQ